MFPGMMDRLCCCFGKSRRFRLVGEDPDFEIGELKRFTLQELRVATNGFSNENLVPSGGCTCRIYKGCLEDGTLVAVKRPSRGNGELLARTQVRVAWLTSNQNVLQLHGVCWTPTEKLLVYPLMANGSLASWLRERQVSQPALTWQKRKQIVLDSARGISHLHSCNPTIIHQNIKAAAILLDEEFRAVVGCLGWVKFMESEDDEPGLFGTLGYMAPEYLQYGRCSEKTDVYAFGIMLLEILTSRPMYRFFELQIGDDLRPLDWVKGILMEKNTQMLVDPNLQDNYIEQEVEELIQILLICTQDSPEDRPVMSEVVRLLQGDGLADKWSEYRAKEIGHEELEEDINRVWSFNSAESLYAEEFCSPR